MNYSEMWDYLVSSARLKIDSGQHLDFDEMMRRLFHVYYPDEELPEPASDKEVATETAPSATPTVARLRSILAFAVFCTRHWQGYGPTTARGLAQEWERLRHIFCCSADCQEVAYKCRSCKNLGKCEVGGDLLIADKILAALHELDQIASPGS